MGDDKLDAQSGGQSEDASSQQPLPPELSVAIERGEFRNAMTLMWDVLNKHAEQGAREIERINREIGTPKERSPLTELSDQIDRIASEAIRKHGEEVVRTETLRLTRQYFSASEDVPPEIKTLRAEIQSRVNRFMRRPIVLILTGILALAGTGLGVGIYLKSQSVEGRTQRKIGGLEKDLTSYKKETDARQADYQKQTTEMIDKRDRQVDSAISESREGMNKRIEGYERDLNSRLADINETAVNAKSSADKMTADFNAHRSTYSADKKFNDSRYSTLETAYIGIEKLIVGLETREDADKTREELTELSGYLERFRHYVDDADKTREEMDELKESLDWLRHYVGDADQTRKGLNGLTKSLDELRHHVDFDVLEESVNQLIELRREYNILAGKPLLRFDPDSL